jgi:two-component system, OmpR family, copper resistance phosphate regulon response regulator CusR
MKLLLIEDEPKTIAYLKKGLTENGFVIDVADNGEEGLFLAIEYSYDLIILDVMLPKMDGWAIMTQLRRKGNQTPVLFLTAKDSVQERVKGLELGADDYLIKPFAFSELLARIRTILRRGQTTSIEKLTVADLDLDPVHHKATRGGQRLDLTPKEFALLLLFLRRKGQVISRTIIAEQVWDINFDSDTNVIDVMVRRLRQKVDDPFEKKLIHTIRGVGYRLDESDVAT